MLSSTPNSTKRSGGYFSTRSLDTPNKLVVVVSPLKRHSSSTPKKRRLENVNIDKFSNSLKSDDEFVSPISFPCSVKTRGSYNKFFTHSTPARCVSSSSKNDIFDSTMNSVQSNDLLLSPTIRKKRSTNASYRTVTDLSLPVMTTPGSNTMNNLFKSNISSSKKKVSFQRKSSVIFPSFSISPFKPEPKLDKNKKAALIACHKKKTPQKESGEFSEPQSFLKMTEMKSSNQSLNRELAKKNISQKLSRRLSYKKPSSFSLINKKKLTITPVKDSDLNMHGSTSTSATKTPLAFTRETTVIGTKSPNLSLNRQQLKKLKIDMSISPRRSSFRRFSSFSQIKPKKTMTPVKENDLIMHGSTSTSATPLAITRETTVIRTKSPNLSLNRELERLKTDMNTSQKLSPHRLSYKKSSSFSQIKPKKATITPVKENGGLILHESTSTSATKTFTRAFTRETTVFGTKSPKVCLNRELERLKTDMNTSQKLSPSRLSYKKSSSFSQTKPKLTVTPVKENNLIMHGSTSTSATKSPLSFTQETTVTGTKSPKVSLNRELERLKTDMNTSQKLSPSRLSYKKSSSFSQTKPKLTVTPVKENNLIMHGSTSTSATKTPLSFTQETTVTGMKSPKVSLNRELERLKTDMNTSQKLSPSRLSYKKSSSFSQTEPQLTVTPVKENNLIMHGSTSTSAIKTPLSFAQETTVIGTKSPNLSLNRQLKRLEIDMNISPRRSSFRKSSYPPVKPKERTITPVKDNELTMHGSISSNETPLSFINETSEEVDSLITLNLSDKSHSKRRKSIRQSSECADETLNIHENLKPEPKLDKNKKAALIACHKKKSPQKESIGEPSDKQSFLTAIGTKSHSNLSLKKELAKIRTDMNISQEISPRRSSYYRRKSSLSPIKRKKRTISPLKDNDLTIHGSTRISATETPLAFTQETSNKDELLKALNLSRKSDVIVIKQQPSRRLRSFNKTDSDSPKTKKKTSEDTSVNKGDEGIKTLFNDSDSYYTSGLKHLFYQSSNSISDLRNISCPKNRSNMNRVFTTSPVVDYTDVSGVKKLFTVSPTGDYRNPLGIKELFAREETYYMNSNNVRELFSDVPGTSGILTNAIKDSNQQPKKAKIDKIFKKVQFEQDHLERTEFLFSEDTSPKKENESSNNENIRKSTEMTPVARRKRNGTKQKVESPVKPQKVVKKEEDLTENIRKSTGMTPVAKRTRNGTKQKESPVKPQKVVKKEEVLTENIRKSTGMTPVARRTRNGTKQKVKSPAKPQKLVKKEEVLKSPESKKIPQKTKNKVVKSTKSDKIIVEVITNQAKPLSKSNVDSLTNSKKTVKSKENESIASSSTSEVTTRAASRKRAPKKKISVGKAILKIKTQSTAKPKKIVKSKRASEEPKTGTEITQKNSSSDVKSSSKSKKTETSESTASNKKTTTAPKKKMSVAKTVLKVKTKSPAKPKKVVKSSKTPGLKTSTQENSNIESPIRKTVKNKTNESTASSSKSKKKTLGASQNQTSPKKKLSVAKTVLKIKIKSPAKPKKVTNKVDKAPKPTGKNTKNSPKPKSPKKQTVKNAKSTTKGKATKKK